MVKRRRGSRRTSARAHATGRSRSWSGGRSTRSPSRSRPRSTRSPSSSPTSRATTSGARTSSGRTRPCTACTRACRGPNGAPTGRRSRTGSRSSACPLEEDFADPDDLADEVWVTVIHELAHHLGIDDDRLDGPRRSTDRQRQSEARERTRPARERRCANPTSIGTRQPAETARGPGVGSVGSRSPPGRTWSSPNVARVSPTNMTTCGAIEIASAV